LRAPFPLRLAGRIAHGVLKSEKKSTRREINIVFVDNKKIRSLSKRFLDEDHDTDVIAFPYDDVPSSDGPFGDIFISLPMAKYNAERFGDDYKTEVVRLIIHGTLHMLGYDDHNPKKKKVMWAKQEKLVQKFKGLV
jgi:probable rRNA maturation factor